MKLLPALLLLLGGCASYGAEESAITAGLNRLEGQPLSAATARLGLPATQMPMGDLTVYTFSRDNVFTGLERPGDPPLKCSVRIAVDGQGIIQNTDWHGNMGACTGLADRLR